MAPEPDRGRRVGILLASLFAVTALIAGAFLFGRSLGTSETSNTPVAASNAEAANTLPPTLVPETAEAPDVAAPAPAEPAEAAAVPPPPSLSGAQEPVAAAAAAVAPAVVRIQNEVGQGSGIIYDGSGLILTNAHVVGQFTAVSVQLPSGVIVPGTVIGADEQTDVAVVQIDTDEEFGVAVLAPDSSVEVGQLAVAIGSPFGLEQTVTAGVVSAVGRVITNPTDDGRFSVVAMIQTDAPINPGNSGGALADREGRVVGMNTSIRTDGTPGNIGVGFAIPSDTARLIADRIVAGEVLEQGFLGVSGETPAMGTPGVRIIEVTVGSGADNAGLAAGDLIVRFNEQPIKSLNDLIAEVRLQAPDDRVTIEYERDGSVDQVEVILGAFAGP